MTGGNKKWKDIDSKGPACYKNIKSKAGYIRLAQAIIASGVKSNDQSFLQSDWCDTLHQLIALGTDKNLVVDRGYLCNIV